MNASYTSDAASFMVTPQRRTSQKTSGPSLKGGFSPQQQQIYPNTSHRGGKMIHRNGPRRAKYNPNVSCTYCGKTGYVEDDCFRHNGFPDDFEFTQSKEFENSKGKSYQDLNTARSKDIKVNLMEYSPGRMLSFKTVYTGKQQTTSLENMDNF